MAKEMTREEFEKLIRAKEDELKDNERDCENCKYHDENGCTLWDCVDEQVSESENMAVGLYLMGYDDGFGDGLEKVKKYRKKAKRWKKKYLELRAIMDMDR